MRERKQGRIHGSISRERWAGALMEVRSLFGLNSAVKKTRDGTTDRWTDPNIVACLRLKMGDGPTDGLRDRQTDPLIEMRGRI